MTRLLLRTSRLQRSPASSAQPSPAPQSAAAATAAVERCSNQQAVHCHSPQPAAAAAAAAGLCPLRLLASPLLAGPGLWHAAPWTEAEPAPRVVLPAACVRPARARQCCRRACLQGNGQVWEGWLSQGGLARKCTFMLNAVLAQTTEQRAELHRQYRLDIYHLLTHKLTQPRRLVLWCAGPEEGAGGAAPPSGPHLLGQLTLPPAAAAGCNAHAW